MKAIILQTSFAACFLSIVATAHMTDQTLLQEGLQLAEQAGARQESILPEHRIMPGGAECLAAAQAQFGPEVVKTRTGLKVGSWNHVPRGCSVQSGGDWAAHFNTMGDEWWQTDPRDPDRKNYIEVLASATESDCLDTAVRAHGYKVTYKRSTLVSGSWNWVPSGCSVQSPGPYQHRRRDQGGDFAAHYNRLKAVVGDGGYTRVPYEPDTLAAHSCYPISATLPEWMRCKGGEDGEPKICYGFEICWGPHYGTQITGTRTSTYDDMSWSVSGYIRWFKNVLPSSVSAGGGHCVYCEDNMPVVGLMVCQERTLVKIPTKDENGEEVEAPNPKTMKMEKVTLDVIMLICGGYAVELDVTMIVDLHLMVTAGPILRLMHGPTMWCEGLMRIWGIATFHDFQFVGAPNYVHYTRLSVDIFWEAMLKANTPTGGVQPFINMRGKLYENGDVRASDVEYLPWPHYGGYSGFPVARGIQVQVAKYGYGNCGKRGSNQLSNLAAACNGKVSCHYKVDHRTIGDSAPGCAKQYYYRWCCKDFCAEGVASAEASGKTIHLYCHQAQAAGNQALSQATTYIVSGNAVNPPANVGTTPSWR